MTSHDLARSRQLDLRKTHTRPSVLGERLDSLVSARVAGLLYLTIIVCGIFAEVVVRSRLIVDGDPSATASNVLGSEALFRMGFAADVVVFLCDVALAILLFLLFRPVSRVLALLAAAFRLTQTAIIATNLLFMFTALLILREADYVGGTLGEGTSEAFALLALDMHKYGYILGLTFFAVSTAITGVLAFRSRVVPRALCVLLVVAGLGYLADSAAFFLVPGYDGDISPMLLAPALVAEVWFALWLLARGSRLESLALSGTEATR